jgi:hypothetical protein
MITSHFQPPSLSQQLTIHPLIPLLIRRLSKVAAIKVFRHNEV